VSPIEFSRHLLSFLAPALVVAVLVAFAARIVLPPAARPRSLGLAVGINALAGVLVLAGGLWFFGRDGKMATYAALMVAEATAQWLGGRAWRS
jgi:hypothetical protein